MHLFSSLNCWRRGKLSVMIVGCEESKPVSDFILFYFRFVCVFIWTLAVSWSTFDNLKSRSSILSYQFVGSFSSSAGFDFLFASFCTFSSTEFSHFQAVISTCIPWCSLQFIFSCCSEVFGSLPFNFFFSKKKNQLLHLDSVQVWSNNPCQFLCVKTRRKSCSFFKRSI